MSSRLPASATELPLRGVLDGCVSNLLATRRDDGLFPYSSTLRAGTIENDYSHPQVIRYTINSLLGLDEAARAGIAGLAPEDVTSMRHDFLEQHLADVRTWADVGLLAVWLSDHDDAADAHQRALARLERLFSTGRPDRLDMQSLSWILWGASVSAAAGDARAEQIARSAMSLVQRSYVHEGSSMPRHSTSVYRRNVVSFGSLTYFLRALHVFATVFSDASAAGRFTVGVQRTMRVQGPRGEWPWMLNVATGIPFDPYPVFSVHQDSMAMLFLLPAFDAGERGVEDTIARSLRWPFGDNELGMSFYVRSPFFAYRAIERVERLPRLRRYARSRRRTTDAAGSFAERPAVRLNTECRSYHLGWILFAWAERLAALGVSGTPSRQVGSGVQARQA